MKHLPQISISVIPHEQQAYETCGNYTEVDEDCIDIEVSETKADYEFLIAVHELIEYYLTQKKGISIKKITAFDKKFESKRKPDNTDEAGDDKNSPYRKEHQYATRIEKLLAKELKVDWRLYEETISLL